jgi:hypothetical protein
MADKEFQELRDRLKHRLVRTIDVASNLVLDALILLLAYLVIRVVRGFAVGGGSSLTNCLAQPIGRFYIRVIRGRIWHFLAAKRAID